MLRTFRFNAFLTKNIRQLNDPDECRAIQRSRLHWISHTLEPGLAGLTLASAAICAAIQPVISELDLVSTQRIVEISGSARRKSHKITDPATQPPSKYWP